MSYTIEILKKCSDLYYNSEELLKLNASECVKIEEELNQKIFNSYPIEISDSLYDMISLKAKEVFPNDSYWKEVGATATGYGIDIKLPFTAGSLEELHKDDFNEWVFHYKPLLISAKLDGCSCVLHFNNGKLVNAISRGDGLTGKDITRHYLKTVNAITEIPYQEDLWFRGELIIPKADFEYIKNNSHYKAARNTVAGLLNSKETNIMVAERTHFLAYHVDSDSELHLETEQKVFEWLKKLGFELPDYNLEQEHFEYLSEDKLIEKVKTLKSSYAYEIDGIVMTVNNHQLWNGFETGTINPKYSRKFKIGGNDNTAETIVESITWQVSKHGRMTPVLNVKPVMIQGVEVSNVTANNYEFLTKLKSGVGANIIIARKGDVIPNVESVLKESTDYDIPTDVKTKIEGVNLVVDDEESSYVDEMLIQKLVFFGQALEIDQWGYGNCKIMYEALDNDYHMIFRPALVFADPLKHNMYSKYIGVNGEKIEKSLLYKKDNLTEVQFASACNAFGNGIGERILQPVYDKYGTLQVSKEQLNTIEGFAETRINQYMTNLADWLYIKQFAENECGIIWKTKEKPMSNKFEGLVLGFTGIRDKELMQYINDNGGIAQDSVTSKTTVLVAKDPNGSSAKLDKAREKGIEIISLEEARSRYMK